MVLMAWVVAGMVLTCSYCSNLMSQMTVRHVPQPIQSIRDLLDHHSYTVIMEPNTVVTDTLANSRSGELWELYRLQEVGRLRYHHAASFLHLLHTLVRDGDHVLITNTVGANLLVAKLFSQTGSCDFYKAGQTLVTSTYCMIASKGSPLIPLMNIR
nr:uncharacterized protein LOC128699512 [Cherax quadricarinatus]